MLKDSSDNCLARASNAAGGSKGRRSTADLSVNGSCVAQGSAAQPLNPSTPQRLNSSSDKFWIGTSGFSYPDWVGPFYPPGTRQGEMLSYYARRFRIVELNFSFYRMPSPGAFEHMVERTPPGFQFLVKMHSDMTHARQLDNVRMFLDALEPLRWSGRLAGVLCQFPQSFHCGRITRSYLRQLAKRLSGSPSFVEFRHRSWNNEAALRELESMRLGIVSVDVPAIPSLFPRRLFGTGDTIYVRFHSRRVALWYDDGKDRYDYLYDDRDLEGWLDAIQELLADTEKVFLLFNNCRRAQATQNAQQVKRLLERRFASETIESAGNENRDIQTLSQSPTEAQTLLPIG